MKLQQAVTANKNGGPQVDFLLEQSPTELAKHFLQALAQHNPTRETASWIDPQVQNLPHPSLREHLDEAGQQIWVDAQKGRVLLCIELEGVVSVAMGPGPKDERRPHSVPEGPRDLGRSPSMPTATRPTIHRPFNPRIKRSRAPLLGGRRGSLGVEDARLFAADLPGTEFGLAEGRLTVIYNHLTFGWMGVPGEYMLFAWVAKQAHLAHYPPHSSGNDFCALRSFVLMDDTVLVEPKIGMRPWISVKVSEEPLSAPTPSMRTRTRSRARSSIGS